MLRISNLSVDNATPIYQLYILLSAVRPARKQLISEEKISANLRNLRLECNTTTNMGIFPTTYASEISNINIDPGMNSSIGCNSNPIGPNWDLNIKKNGSDRAISVNRCQVEVNEMDDYETYDADEPNHSMKVTSHVLIKDFHENFEDDSFSDEEIDRLVGRNLV